jgi:hypothetical protein
MNDVNEKRLIFCGQKKGERTRFFFFFEQQGKSPFTKV